MRLLLAIDRFSSSAKTIQLAKQYLSGVEGTEVTVLYISKEKTSVYYRTDIGMQQVLSKEEWQRRDELDVAIAKEFRPWGRQVQFRHETGNPAKVICEVARELAADLVILGTPTHNHELIRAGSVAHQVVNQIDRPLLLAN